MMSWQHSVDICPCWLNMHLSHSFLKDRLTQTSIQRQSSVSMSAGPFPAIVHRSSEYPTFKTTCLLCVHLHESKTNHKMIMQYIISFKQDGKPPTTMLWWFFSLLTIFPFKLNRIEAIWSSQFVNFQVNITF